MAGFKVKVLTDSISPDGVRISSVAYQAPRSVLAEVNTHRAVTKGTDEIAGMLLEEDLSRNAESSRAISFNRKLALVTGEPYYPADLPDGELMGESRGMQATAPIDPARKAEGQAIYRDLAIAVAKGAKEIADCGFHKQDVNRLLEPWSWTRGVITATEMPNFFALRCDHRAYPPFRFLARCIWVALFRSTPQTVNWGDWHLPFIDGPDYPEAQTRMYAAVNAGFENPHGFSSWQEYILATWSAARCARVSLYQIGTKERNWDKDTDTYNKLAGAFPLHASPMEHPALCAKAGGIQRGFPKSNFRAPWVQMRKFLTGENIVEYQPAPAEIQSWNVPEEVFAGSPGTDW